MKVFENTKISGVLLVGLLSMNQNVGALEIVPQSPIAGEPENEMREDKNNNMGWFNLIETKWFLINPDIPSGTVLISTEGSEPVHRLAVFRGLDVDGSPMRDFENYNDLVNEDNGLTILSKSYDGTIKIEVEENTHYWLMVTPFLHNGLVPLSPFRLVACETSVIMDKIHGFSSPPSALGTVYMHGEWYGLGVGRTESWNLARFVPFTQIGENGFSTGTIAGDWRALAATEDYQNGTYDPIDSLSVEESDGRVVIYDDSGILWENGREIHFTEHITYHPDYPHPGFQWWVEYNYNSY